MAYNGQFSITTTSNAGAFLLTDTSTGSDGNLTGRKVNLYQASGQLLVPEIDWPIGQSTLLVNVLQQDYSLDVRVNWISSSPLAPPSTYIYSLIYAFVKYGQDFVYGLVEQQTANPGLTQDQNWYGNKVIVMSLIESAQLSIDNGQSLYNAQVCISLYQQYINNSNYYF